MSATLYESDFFAWADEQVRLLRAGKLSEADIGHIAEEIETMGKTEKRELVSRLKILLLHLLKWQYQPAYRGKSWRLSIMEQRREVARHLNDNPSLQARLTETLADAYGDATLGAARETDLEPDAFPAECPWTFDQIMAADFWPDLA